VAIERRQFLVRSDVPNRNASIVRSGREPATVGGKRNAIGPRSRGNPGGILVMRADIPETNVRAGRDKSLTVGQHCQSSYPSGMSQKDGGSANRGVWGV